MFAVGNFQFGSCLFLDQRRPARRHGLVTVVFGSDKILVARHVASVCIRADAALPEKRSRQMLSLWNRPKQIQFI